MGVGLKVFDDPIKLLEGSWPTPLVRLRGFSRNGYEVWAKLEFFNPFSRSVKDRAVWFMIKGALSEGTLSPNSKLYEATSGNVGLAMASISNLLKLRFRAYLPKHSPRTTEVVLKVLGAEVIRTNYECIGDEMVSHVHDEALRDGAAHLNQYVNNYNFIAHVETTGREIDEQLSSINKSPPKAVIAGVGTSGHSAGIAKYFRDRYGSRAPKFIAVYPREGDPIPGLRPASVKPKWVGVIKPDLSVEVSVEEAVTAAVLIARTNGLFVGISSGAVAAAYEVVKDSLGEGVYVLIFPDDGLKYVELFDAWLRSRSDLLERYAEVLGSGVCRDYG